MKLKTKYDNLYLGLAAGVLIPFIAFVATWWLTYEGSLADYLKGFSKIHKLTSLISLSVIPNLLLFFTFIWTERYRSARGVLFATLLFAILVAIIKFS